MKPMLANPRSSIAHVEGSGTAATEPPVMPSEPLLAALPTIKPVDPMPNTSTRRSIGDVISTLPRTTFFVGPSKISAPAWSEVGNLMPFTAPLAMLVMFDGKPALDVVKKSLAAKVMVVGVDNPVNVKARVILPRLAMAPGDADRTSKISLADDALGPPVRFTEVPLATVNGPSGNVALEGRAV